MSLFILSSFSPCFSQMFSDNLCFISHQPQNTCQKLHLSLIQDSRFLAIPNQQPAKTINHHYTLVPGMVFFPLKAILAFASQWAESNPAVQHVSALSSYRATQENKAVVEKEFGRGGHGEGARSIRKHLHSAEQSRTGQHMCGMASGAGESQLQVHRHRR